MGREVLQEAYYTRLREMLPADLEALIESGSFDHPEPPAYYSNPSEES